MLWLEVFAQVCECFCWVCHAYCLMSNHYHLLIETPEGNLSAGMRQLNGVYTQRFNRVHGRVGHVFQGRFKGVVVERDAYLLELARYIVLNPVRARMVSDVGDWPWSSYRAMLGVDACPTWLNARGLLAAFGVRPSGARARYIDFVRACRGGVAKCLGGSARPALSGRRCVPGAYAGAERSERRGGLDRGSPCAPQAAGKIIERLPGAWKG
ncbi:MAG: transposase [Rhodocyclaceae bacterium]